MFDKDKHKIIMLRVLRQIYKDSYLGKRLGFKGGTMAFLFYGLPRMSVDLDFDLLMNSQEYLILDKLEKILFELGEVKEKIIKKNTLFLLLDYGFEERKLKVEIRRKRTKTRFILRDYLGISMLVMNRGAMVASKLLALVDRKKLANRDIFDLWFFLKNDWQIDEDLLWQEAKTKKEVLIKKAIVKIKKVKDNELMFGLGDLLDNKTKDWVRKNLKKELLFNLRLLIR